ncbi:MAG: hypothetical protein IKM18_04150 [Clostridia bacterium]|nr:hypothetical protein [Clostridia bacterium]MBR3715079.1 hypothetical protein [Clostridia bacterium]
MKMKRVTIFAGHYGSGKTNIAVSYALSLAKEGKDVTIADLDIVNPYYRTKDSSEILEKNGIDLISSPYANTNVDVPALPSEAYRVTDDLSRYAVIDVGGDDRGALAMGRYSPKLLEENNFDMLAVINCFRPLTSDALSTVEVMREVELACKMPFTGIINNSNLGRDTTEETVLSSLAYAEEVSRITGLPIVMTSVLEELYPGLKDKIPNAFPINIYVKAKI